MNIIFFGSDNFAVSPLKALIKSSHKVSCVVTQPDRKKGRGLRLEGTAVKARGLEAGLKVYQPTRINTSEAIKFLKSFDADLFIVVAYGQILSKDILDIPRIFAINAHASVLPKYRGAAPINWAIIKGENATGVTIMKMSEKLDAGPIIMQQLLTIEPSDTADTLSDKLSEISAELLLESLKCIEDKTYKLTQQIEIEATLAPKLTKDAGLINWEKSAQEIYNLIRGCVSWPGAFTYYRGKLLKIYKARVVSGKLALRVQCGEVVKVAKDGINVATGKDVLVIEELQIEGKRLMRAEEFIAGHNIYSGECFEKK